MRASFSASSRSTCRVDLLDQRQHVAHAEDARSHAVRLEGLQRVGFFADADEQDRLPGDLAHRERRAAARVAVGLGQHHAGQVQRGTESPRRIDGVLAGHAVDDEQRLDRLQARARSRTSRHHFLVDVQAARGIDHQHVVYTAARGVSAAAAMAMGDWSALAGATSISSCWPRRWSCSIAAGRRTSVETSSTRLRSRV